jgi:hypothetical protein
MRLRLRDDRSRGMWDIDQRLKLRSSLNFDCSPHHSHRQLQGEEEAELERVLHAASPGLSNRRTPRPPGPGLDPK